MDGTRRRVLYQLNSRWIYGKIVRDSAFSCEGISLTAVFNSRYSTLLSSSYKWLQCHSSRASTTATMHKDRVSLVMIL